MEAFRSSVLPAPVAQGSELDRNAVNAWLESIVVVKTMRASGSGFFVSPQGHLITNVHVVGDEDDVIVKTNASEKFFAKVLSRSTFRDLALLKIDVAEVKPLPLGSVGPESRGKAVYAVGAPAAPPFGSLEQTVTKGIISAVRQLPAPFNPSIEIEFVQTDAAINPGNSGGPLIDENGHVVGVNTSKAVDVKVEGLNFAVSVTEIRNAFAEYLP